MTITKNYQGAYVIKDIIDGYLVERVYMGYTKAEARRLFKAYCRGVAA